MKYTNYKNLASHERMYDDPACCETHDGDVSASINLYFVGLERHEGAYSGG